MTCSEQERRQQAEALRTAFHALWTEAQAKNAREGQEGLITYTNMNHIADILRTDAPRYFDGGHLPATIDAGLQLAITLLDPSKGRMKANLKKALCLAGGASGAGLIWICLAQILNPGLLASVAAFFAGGVAGSILAPVGVVGGISLLVASLYAAMQKMTPQQRTVKCHSLVMQAIDKWIKNGEKNDRIIATAYVKRNELPQ